MPRSVCRRFIAIAAIVVGALLAAWVAFSIIVIGHPTLTEHPTAADAIVVLGPSNKRVPQAVALARGLDVTNLVLSIGDFKVQRETTCSQRDLDVTCFTPNPYNTAGEAAEIGTLAAQHGWTRIIVIAAKAQASRAKYLIGQCFPGEIEMVASTNPESITRGLDWIWTSIYQTAAWAKALVTDPCPPPHPAQVTQSASLPG